MRASGEQDRAAGGRGGPVASTRRARRGALAIGVAALAAAGVSACGSSGSAHGGSGSAQSLLRQTFSRSHTVRSGDLSFGLVMTPTGSSVITSPVTLTLSGPFQSRGRGRTPESALTIGFSGLGKHGSFGVRTTSSAAYVNLENTNYQLPAADFDKLRTTLSGNGSQSSAPGLSSFGIDPENWLVDPKIVGTQTVGGVLCEHIRARVDVARFLQGVNTVLAREASTERSATGHAERIPAATIAKIARTVRDPTLDVDTGRSDTTLRRLSLDASAPVSGTTSTRLGGLSSARFTLTFAYAHLNQPQTISAPSDVHSYAELQTRLQSIGAQLESSLSGGLGSSGTSGSGSTGSGSTGSGNTGSSGSVSRYSRCIDRASGDVRKMRHCATLLQGGS